MEKYQDKYRIPSARLPTWNYGLQASYFVTICAADRKPFFGAVIDAEMRLSEIGEVVEREWVNTPSIRPDMNLTLDAFCVMPNHFHGIITIGENQYNNRGETGAVGNRFGAQSKNLASIMRGFKSAVTVAARQINPQFSWQARFHDHIIRNDAEFRRIRNYIIQNPANWEKDTFHKKQSPR